MQAVTAAMIRIASSPSRKTIVAALVITVASLAPSPVFARASSRASSSSSLVSRIWRRSAPEAISSARPSTPRAPYQTMPSISATSCGSNAFSLISGPNSKNA